MIDAKNAIRKSAEGKEECIKKIMERVEKSVLDACERGELFTEIHKFRQPYMEDVKTHLTHLGYRVEENAEHFIVNWETP